MNRQEPSRPTPPVLRIKKGAVIDIEEGDSREEIHPLRPMSSASEARGYFWSFLQMGTTRGGRKGSVGSLLVLLLVAAGVFFALRLVTRPVSKGIVSGYEATLRADPAVDLLVASVTLVPVSGTGGGGTVSALFKLPDSGAATLASKELSGPLTVVAAKMPYRGLEKRLTAEIRIGGAALMLASDVPTR
jgi:hypothetical protein